MLMCRFFVNIEQIPPVLRWLRYFSTLGYTLEALAVNEVGAGLMIVVSLPDALAADNELNWQDTLAGVPVEINASLIMSTLFGFNLGRYYR